MNIFNRDFKTQKEFFHALKDNESQILDLKKASVYKSADKGQGIYNLPIFNKVNSEKEIYKEGFIYPVINSTLWLDSHNDVHLKGCYKKTVKEQQGKVYYIDSHLKGLSNIIAKRQDVEMFIDDIDWQLLGKDLQGSTEALVFKIAKENVKSDYLDLIESDKDLQNSFAMRYVKIKMAVNSKDKEFAENKDFYESVINDIANKELAEKNGYFFGVEELAIVGEGSLCPVIGGSNSATSIIQLEPAEATQIEIKEPAEATQQQKRVLIF